MTKFADSLGLKRLVTKIAEAVGKGTWLPVRKGKGDSSVIVGGSNRATGNYSYAEGANTTADGFGSHAEGGATNADSNYSHAEGSGTQAAGEVSHAEGHHTIARGKYSHTEGLGTETGGYGYGSHAQGYYNYENSSFIDMVGVGNNMVDRKNAFVIYVTRGTNGVPNINDPKNGYQYLLGVGGYQGQDIAEGMKSVQEVIADLEKGVAASETMTVEEIREIMSA